VSLFVRSIALLDLLRLALALCRGRHLNQVAEALAVASDAVNFKIFGLATLLQIPREGVGDESLPVALRLLVRVRAGVIHSNDSFLLVLDTVLLNS